MDWEGKTLIVARREYFPLLFRFKNANPTYDLKIVDKNEFLDISSISYSADPIPFLIAEGIDYSQALKYKELFRLDPSFSDDKSKRLYEAIKKCLRKDDLGDYELRNSRIVLFEIDEENELKEVIKRQGFTFEERHMQDIGIEVKWGNAPKPRLYYFKSKYSQYFHIFSDIRKRLNDDDSSKERIKILLSDESDIFYISTMSYVFGIPCFYKSRSTLMSKPSVKKKIKDIHAKKDFSFAEEELKDESLFSLNEIIDKYGLRKASFDFDYAYLNLLEIISSLSYSEVKNDHGILVSRSFEIDGDSLVYVTNFQDDVFYRNYADDNVLSDKELSSLNLNCSYDKTLLDRRLKLNYLRYSNIVLLSRVLLHFDDSIYDSPLLSDLGLKREDFLSPKEDADGLLTDKARNLYVGRHIDKEFMKPSIVPFPPEYGDFQSYDHSYTKISKPVIRKKHWSVTNIESYVYCPFAYYMRELIGEEKDNQSAIRLGIFAHKVMESSLKDDFDLDMALAEGKKAYLKAIEDSKETEKPEDALFLRLASFYCGEAAKHANLLAKKSDLIKRDQGSEVPISFELQDDKGTIYPFVGKIDRIIYSRKGDKNYYTIVDYKTGSETFSSKETLAGRSIQLPLYYYAFTNSSMGKDLVNDTIFGGFGISKVYQTKPKDFFGDAFAKSFRIKGAALNSLDYFASIDPSAIKTNKDGEETLSRYGGEFVAKTQDSFEDLDSPLPLFKTSAKYSLKDIVEMSKQSAIRIIHAIENNEFPIAPTSYGLLSFNEDNLYCQGCSFKDICYHSKKDAKNHRLSIDRKIADDTAKRKEDEADALK